jgi:excisionase family DNA binding protein
MPDEILTLPEVAQLLKVADKTVYTMAQKGELPAFKVGGQWRFRRADLDSWIDARTRRGDAGSEGELK